MGAASREGLITLLADSLGRGHWRVACRRFLMLEASGAEVPVNYRAECAVLLARCSGIEVRKMLVDACAWARMVGAAVAAPEMPAPAARRASAPRPRTAPARAPATKPAAPRPSAQVVPLIQPVPPTSEKPQPAESGERPIRTQWRPMPTWLQ